MKRCTTAILAGGKSSRIGFDKTLLRFDHQLLLDSIYNKISVLTDKIIIIGPYRAESTIDPERFIDDLIPGLGPLGGLYTALKTSNSDIFLLSCDMPGIEAIHASALFAYFDQDNQAIIATSTKGIEPLFAIYKSSCLPALETAIKEGDFALYRFIGKLHAKFVDFRKSCKDSDIFFNINTLSDYKKALYLKRYNQNKIDKLSLEE